MNPDSPVPAVTRPPSPKAKWYVRFALVAIALGLATVFGIAASLDPYDDAGRPRTMATHTQLGVPTCNFLTWTGKPCPSCGMTTSFALLVRGDVGASLKANWVGTIIALVWATLLVWSAACAVMGKFLGIPRGRGELIATILVGVLLALMMMRWGVVMLSG